MALTIKICGLKTAGAVAAALEAGADMIGFVFFPKSPRHLDLKDAGFLADCVRGKAEIVALTVNADDALLADITENLRPDWHQLHGSETPERVSQIKASFAPRVMKVYWAFQRRATLPASPILPELPAACCSTPNRRRMPAVQVVWGAALTGRF